MPRELNTCAAPAGATATFLDSTHLRVNVGANNVAQPGTISFKVSNGAGSASNLVGLDVAAPGQNPASTITSLSPDWVFSHGASSKQFTLLVTGTNFVDGATVQWNGDDRPTQFVDSTHLRATISGLDQLSPASNSITVKNPSPGGGTSKVLTFIVRQLFRLFIPLVIRLAWPDQARPPK